MEDVMLLENPRQKRRTPPRGKGGRFRRRRSSTRRRRRRNPTTVAVAKPRRRARRRNMAAAPAVKRRRANPAHPVRRRRRSNPGGRRGLIPSMRQVTGTLMEAGGLVAAEFVGDFGSRMLHQKTPLGPWVARAVGEERARPVLQIALGVLGAPLLRRFKAPRALTRYWEVANVASALIALTAQWRSRAFQQAGLADWLEYPAPFESQGAAAMIEAPNMIENLADWEVAAISSSGDPFSL